MTTDRSSRLCQRQPIAAVHVVGAFRSRSPPACPSIVWHVHTTQPPLSKLSISHNNGSPCRSMKSRLNRTPKSPGRGCPRRKSARLEIKVLMSMSVICSPSVPKQLTVLSLRWCMRFGAGWAGSTFDRHAFPFPQMPGAKPLEPHRSAYVTATPVAAPPRSLRAFTSANRSLACGSAAT